MLGIFLISCGNTQEKKINSNTTIVTKSIPLKNIPVGMNPDALFLTPNRKKLYVANSAEDYISIINTERDSVVKTISGLSKSWGFHKIPHTEMLALSTNSGQVALIDFGTDTIVRKKQYEYKFGDITADLKGEYLFVIAIFQEKVFKIKVSDLAIVASYDTGNEPDGMDISKDGKKLFVTNRGDGTISVISIADNTSTMIDTGGKPELINSNADHSRIYASNFDLNVMHIIDAETNAILHNVSGLKGPEGAYYEKERRILYISNFNSNEVYTYQDEDYTSVTNKFVTGKNPLSLVTVNDKLYVSNYSDNSVSVIDLKP